MAYDEEKQQIVPVEKLESENAAKGKKIVL